MGNRSTVRSPCMASLQTELNACAGGEGVLLAMRNSKPPVGARAAQDNYAWLLREDSGKVAVVDPSEAAPVVEALESRRARARCAASRKGCSLVSSW